MKLLSPVDQTPVSNFMIFCVPVLNEGFGGIFVRPHMTERQNTPPSGDESFEFI